MKIYRSAKDGNREIIMTRKDSGVEVGVRFDCRLPSLMIRRMLNEETEDAAMKAFIEGEDVHPNSLPYYGRKLIKLAQSCTYEDCRMYVGDGADEVAQWLAKYFRFICEKTSF